MIPLLRTIGCASPARRRSALLAALVLLAAFITLRRWSDLLPSSAHAREFPGNAQHDESRAAIRGPMIPAPMGPTAWPDEPVRDLFRWSGEPITAPLPPVNAAAIRDLAAAQLHLQGIVLSDAPRAIINGRARKAGDEISGFLLTSIESRRIIVTRDGVAVELTLAHAAHQPTRPE